MSAAAKTCAGGRGRPPKPGRARCEWCLPAAAQAQHEMRERRKADGRCIGCARKFSGRTRRGKMLVRCPDCRAKQAERQRRPTALRGEAYCTALRRARRAQGLCRECGEKLRNPRFSACAKCRLARSETRNARRAELRARGICPHCHSRPAAPGRKLCEICLRRKRERRAEA